VAAEAGRATAKLAIAMAAKSRATIRVLIKVLLSLKKGNSDQNEMD
jgi:hypothetical protein